MTLTYMYGIMVAFELTMATVVAWGHNKGLNFRKAVTDSEATGTGNDGKGGGCTMLFCDELGKCSFVGKGSTGEYLVYIVIQSS